RGRAARPGAGRWRRRAQPLLCWGRRGVRPVGGVRPVASVRSILAAVVATVASAALLAGCTTTRTIDSPRLEQQVRSYAVRLGNRPASARCPDRIPVMRGYT